MAGLQTELDRLSTEELVRYTVKEEELAPALALVRRFGHHRFGAGVLRDYYLSLPEGREEMVTDLRLVNERDGTALIGLATTGHRYLYLCVAGVAVYLGAFAEGVQDEVLLELFGYQTIDDYFKQVAEFEKLPPLSDAGATLEPVTCVACGVAPGELHLFGCPVELCPWCEGQVIHCNCRFDLLGVERIDSEEQLDQFAELLDTKGRTPFQAGQNPSYPSTGEGDGPAGVE